MKSQRLTVGQRYKELTSFVDLCFANFEPVDHNLDYKEIANATGLSLATIYRLAYHQFSLAVHFGTIQALGYAAGLRLELTESNVKSRLSLRRI